MRRLALLLLAVAPSLASAAQAPAPTPRESYTAECVVSNPGYPGRCTVSEAAPRSRSPEAACQRVLACLNDVRCVKTYCNATTVRGGWKLVSATRR